MYIFFWIVLFIFLLVKMLMIPSIKDAREDAVAWQQFLEKWGFDDVPNPYFFKGGMIWFYSKPVRTLEAEHPEFSREVQQWFVRLHEVQERNGRRLFTLLAIMLVTGLPMLIL
ncbi:hypothetical protein [Entomospira culicis]|uniref:Uncharacterized protein n=1 Tax=Entomospira culicis TaxID=2719989 RepID=A0A968GIM4_9SPIO|nr:hypothetical protein [Entomospira culicis]NIZ19436.1 hypothetical protein [Entomospira culicis]NIZ69659.1 hypothetical protein [Entomospira culicis]WDI36770.1 hypothetical protein PVA46_05450 [Entomospira culicis]WDI38399.1 hypothetical protein PVA47_05460 [Entomospira culicis]